MLSLLLLSYNSTTFGFTYVSTAVREAIERNDN